MTTKRQKAEKSPKGSGVPTESLAKEPYFEFNSYPSGGYGGNYYVRLKNNDPKLRGDPIMHGQTIEVLWPDSETSQHTVTCETTSDKFYCRDACETFYTTYFYPFITIDDHHGTNLGEVKLTSIKDIKLRIIKEI